ncbi:MAG TPA: hypothetical protein VMW62_09960 [Chloroflexota bacterium]|nr:hypothetical protein [Chloroflexota bacterium]
MLRVLREAGLAIGIIVVLLGAVLVIRPNTLQSLSQYGPELGTRASEAVSSTPAAPVTNITDVSQLQSAFNAAAGEPRLILLLSPT